MYQELGKYIGIYVHLFGKYIGIYAKLFGTFEEFSTRMNTTENLKKETSN
jgi:hypothetical protein